MDVDNESIAEAKNRLLRCGRAVPNSNTTELLATSYPILIVQNNSRARNVISYSIRSTAYKTFHEPPYQLSESET